MAAFGGGYAQSVLRRLDHAGFAVAELEPAIALFRETLGAQVGPVFEDPLQRVRLCFAEYAGNRVELIAPMGDDSPVSQILAGANGGGLYHLCFETDDLDAEFQRLRTQASFRPGRPSRRSRSVGGAWCSCSTASPD